MRFSTPSSTPQVILPRFRVWELLFFWGRKGSIGSYLYQAVISIPFTSNAVVCADSIGSSLLRTAVTTLQAIPRYEIALVEVPVPPR